MVMSERGVSGHPYGEHPELPQAFTFAAAVDLTPEQADELRARFNALGDGQHRVLHLPSDLDVLGEYRVRATGEDDDVALKCNSCDFISVKDGGALASNLLIEARQHWQQAHGGGS